MSAMSNTDSSTSSLNPCDVRPAASALRDCHAGSVLAYNTTAALAGLLACLRRMLLCISVRGCWTGSMGSSRLCSLRQMPRCHSDLADWRFIGPEQQDKRAHI